jgi:hypothetical protein
MSKCQDVGALRPERRALDLALLKASQPVRLELPLRSHCHRQKQTAQPVGLLEGHQKDWERERRLRVGRRDWREELV